MASYNLGGLSYTLECSCVGGLAHGLSEIMNKEVFQLRVTRTFPGRKDSSCSIIRIQRRHLKQAMLSPHVL